MDMENRERWWVEFDRVIDIQLIKETSNSVKGIVVR